MGSLKLPVVVAGTTGGPKINSGVRPSETDMHFCWSPVEIRLRLQTRLPLAADRTASRRVNRGPVVGWIFRSQRIPGSQIGTRSTVNRSFLKPRGSEFVDRGNPEVFVQIDGVVDERNVFRFQQLAHQRGSGKVRSAAQCAHAVDNPMSRYVVATRGGIQRPADHTRRTFSAQSCADMPVGRNFSTGNRSHHVVHAVVKIAVRLH